MSGWDAERDHMIQRLRQLFDEVDRAKQSTNTALSHAAASLGCCDLAVLMLRGRKQRDEHFGADIFGEPGWDILLDLYVAYCRGIAIDTTSACIAARVAPTTALRWINKLAAVGLIERVSDHDDARRMFCHLSDDGLRKVEVYLDAYTSWVATSHRPERFRGTQHGDR